MKISHLFAVLLLLAARPATPTPFAPAEHRRGEEQTFLTFPEWFLVFSPAEYADHVRTHQPSDFPFWGHIRQFWTSYGAVIDVTRARRYPPNPGYHVMINTIGVSTTVEYGIRSGYETIIGRLAELTASQRTAEDDFGARVAQQYVDFIRVRPWYEFDFFGRLTELWRDVPMSGAGKVRKIERRYALTTEYLVKAAYGKLIEKATHAGYERPRFVTHVAYRTAPGSAPTTALLPRYEAFTGAARELASHGANFCEIAGNGPAAAVLVSVLADSGWRPPANSLSLFEQPVITAPGRKRVALIARVDELAAVLRELEPPAITIEHVFDY
jgi:hypothetical protein